MITIIRRLGCAAALAAFLLAGCATTRNAAPTDLEYEPTTPPLAEDEWGALDQEGGQHLRNAMTGYARSRALDFLDMFEAGLSFGPWTRVEAQYLVGFWGFGVTESQYWRLGRRSAVANEEAATVSFIPFPVSLVLFPAAVWGDKTRGTIAMMGGVSYETEDAIWPDPVFTETPPRVERIRMAFMERDVETHRFKLTGDSFTVGAEAHLLIGARARVMPLQILDFAAGLLGWDPASDDVER